MSATHSYLVPWGDDDLEVLRMKWHIANERAMECEKLKSELNRIGETYGRKAHNSLDINPLICGSIVKCAELAVSNLYPTGLLKSDFEYFVTGDSERESEKIELIKQEKNRVPECPSFL